MSEKETIEQITKAAKYYGEKGEDQLVKDIYTIVSKQKSEGKLTNEQLLAFAKKVAPFLNASQKKKLEGLIEKITSE